MTKMGYRLLAGLFASMFLLSMVSAYYDDSYQNTYRYSATTYGHGCDSYTKSVEYKKNTAQVYDYSGSEKRTTYSRIVREDYNPCRGYAPSGYSNRYQTTACDRYYYGNGCAGYPDTHFRYQRVFENRDYPYQSYREPYYYKARWNQYDGYDWRY